LLKKIISLKNLPALLIILFVVQGIIYSGTYLLWDPWDEAIHFAYLQHIIEEKTIPTHDDYLSNEIIFTFDKTPLPLLWIEDWDCCNVTKDFKLYDYTTFWETFDLEQLQQNKDVISSQTLDSRTNYTPFIHIYEGHPPIGYLVQVPVYLLFYDQDILTRVFALRIFSVLIFAAAAIVAYKTISLLFDDRLMRVGSLMFIVFNPMFMNTVNRVSNESVTILLFSIFLFLLVFYLKGKTNTLHVVLIGFILGLGILTKPTIMPAVLLVPTFIFLKYIQNNPNKLRINLLHSLKNLGIIFGITISMGSWWYFEKFAAGNPTGHIDFRPLTFDQFFQGLFLIPWDRFTDLFFRTFWGFFGMNLFVLPDLYYQTILIILGISIAGLGYGIALKIKHRGRKIIRDWRYQSIFALGLSTLFIILAQTLFNVQFFVSFGNIFPFSWFSFISFTAIAMILLLGFRTIIINSTLKRFKEESLLVSFIVLIIFSSTTFFWLVPNYYSGILNF